MKRFIAVCAVSLLLGIALAVCVRSGRTDLLAQEEIRDAAVLVGVWDGIGTGGASGDYINDVLRKLDQAETILRVRFTGEREDMAQSTLSKVDVLEVYRGDATLTGRQIAVYERGFFFIQEGELRYRCAAYVAPMREGEDYCVFVSKLPHRRSLGMGVDEYTQEWSDANSNLPCLIPCGTDKSGAFIVPDTRQAGYGELKGYDYVLSDVGAVSMIEMLEGAIRARFTGNDA